MDQEQRRRLLRELRYGDQDPLRSVSRDRLERRAREYLVAGEEDRAREEEHGTIRPPLPGRGAGEAMARGGMAVENWAGQNGLRPGGGAGRWARKAAYGEAGPVDRVMAGLDAADFIPNPATAAVGLLPRAAKSAARRQAGRSTIRGAERKAFPGIYDDPREIVARANERLEPEDPALEELFGVTRKDLAEMSKRAGNMPGSFNNMAKNPKGSAAADKIMKPANTNRIVDILQEGYDTPVGEGMRGWYVMDPAYQRLSELDPENALQLGKDMNAYTAMASPGSDVLTEINRGSMANKLAQEGRFEEFVEHGNKTQAEKKALGEGWENVKGHPYHSTAHGTPMQGYYDSGEITLKEPKVSLYNQASRDPRVGFQTDFQVGDAHWSRGVGLADARTNKAFGASYTGPEAQATQEWWQGVSKQADMEAVPGQASLWGLLAPATGVETPVGAPKLELIAKSIMKTAKREGLPPQLVRDEFLKGERQIGNATPEMLAALTAMGAGGMVALDKMLGQEGEK